MGSSVSKQASRSAVGPPKGAGNALEPGDTSTVTVSDPVTTVGMEDMDDEVGRKMVKLLADLDALIGIVRKQSAECDRILLQVRDMQLRDEMVLSEARAWLARAAEARVVSSRGSAA